MGKKYSATEKLTLIRSKIADLNSEAEGLEMSIRQERAIVKSYTCVTLSDVESLIEPYRSELKRIKDMLDLAKSFSGPDPNAGSTQALEEKVSLLKAILLDFDNFIESAIDKHITDKR